MWGRALRSRQRSSVKYVWIQKYQSHWPISAMCQVLDVSESGYYHHWARGTACHRIPDDELLTHNRAIHCDVKGEYRWPRMWNALQAKGISACAN
jgi:putative transposase